jgi:hypothetical protein
MVFFTLKITPGLFDTSVTYEAQQPHMDEYWLSGATIPEIVEKVKRALGDDPSWTETASIDLYYKATNCRGYLNAWHNVGSGNKTQLVNLIYGE